jgi:replication factor A1
MIQEKRNELGPEVINDESAALIVARELGVDSVKMSPSARIQIKDIDESTKNVAGLIGRVDRIGEVRTFTRKDDKSEGRVASIFISDDTGSIRVALWDDMTRAITEDHISVGSIIQIRGAYVKMGLRDTPELNLGRVGTVKPLENDEIEELGIDFDSKAAGEVMEISSLQEGTFDISIKAKVQRKFNISTFTKKDGVEGKVLAMVVADESGSTRLVFWDEKVDDADGIEVGEVIRVSHAYTRPNRDGTDVEVHVGRTTVIERNLKDKIEAAESTFVSTTEPLGMTDIADLKVGMRDVDVEAKIATIEEMRTFTRKDGGEGKVQNIVIADKTSKVRVTFWGDDIDKIAKAKEGDVLRILHGWVKEGFRGGVELQIGNRAEVTLNPKGSKLKQLDLSKVTEDASSSGTTTGSAEPVGMTSISDLSLEMKDVDIEGKVITAYDVKTFTKRDGSGEGRLRNIIIADQTSKIRVTFWNDDVDTVADIQEGDVIRILHGYVKEGFKGGLEYQVGWKGEIILNPKDSDLKQLDLSDIAFETATAKAPRVLIGEIDDGLEGKNAEICGIIVDISQSRVYYDACPTCNKKVEYANDQYTCNSCGVVESVEPRMRYKITVDDGSGSIRVTMFGTDGEKLLGMDAERAKELTVKSGRDDEPIRASPEEVRGRYVSLEGRVRKFGDSLEMTSIDHEFADPVQEIKRLKEVIQKETS